MLSIQGQPSGNQPPPPELSECFIGWNCLGRQQIARKQVRRCPARPWKTTAILQAFVGGASKRPRLMYPRKRSAATPLASRPRPAATLVVRGADSELCKGRPTVVLGMIIPPQLARGPTNPNNFWVFPTTTPPFSANDPLGLYEYLARQTGHGLAKSLGLGLASVHCGTAFALKALACQIGTMLVLGRCNASGGCASRSRGPWDRRSAASRLAVGRPSRIRLCHQYS